MGLVSQLWGCVDCTTIAMVTDASMKATAWTKRDVWSFKAFELVSGQHKQISCCSGPWDHAHPAPLQTWSILQSMLAGLIKLSLITASLGSFGFITTHGHSVLKVPFGLRQLYWGTHTEVSETNHHTSSTGASTEHWFRHPGLVHFDSD